MDKVFCFSVRELRNSATYFLEVVTEFLNVAEFGGHEKYQDFMPVPFVKIRPVVGLVVCVFLSKISKLD